MQLTQKQDDEILSNPRLKGHKLSLTCACIDATSKYVFTGSKDGSIIKWCLETRKIVGKINPIPKKEYESNEKLQKKHHTKHVNCLAISSDNRFLASGGWDKQIRIWSPDDLTWIHTFKLHKQEVTALAFRQGHPTLYSGSADRSVALWTLEDDDNRCYVESLYGHESVITSLDALRRERVLSAGGRDQSIRVWKIVEQAQTVFECKHESVDVAKYIDDKTFVTGGEDGTISIWTTMKRTPIFSLPNAHNNKSATNGNEKDDREDTSRDNLRFDQTGLAFWISALATHSFKLPKQQQAQGTKRQKLDHDQDYDGEEANDKDSDHESDAGEDGVEVTTSDRQTSEKQIVALLASGSCNSEIRIWKLIKSGSKYELKLHQVIECPGFVNDLTFTSDAKNLVAACGQEHKFGRWWKLKNSKNCMRVFDVNKC